MNAESRPLWEDNVREVIMSDGYLNFVGQLSLLHILRG